MEYLLGIDIGTTGCKASLYDKEGRIYGTGYRKYQILSKHPGWAEENPDEWWAKSIESIKDCLLSSGIPPDKIMAAGVSCTNGIIPVNKGGECLTNAIMQIDGRASKQADFFEQVIGKDKVFSITGNRVAPGAFSVPSIIWIKDHEPEIYKNTYKFLSPAGYIVNKMTGIFTMDHTRASTTLLYNIKQREWSRSICDLVKLDITKLPVISNSEEVVGYVKKEVANVTGLTAGMPVITGVMDSVAACIGIGTLQSHSPALILGTVARLGIPICKEFFDDRFLNTRFTKEIPYLLMSPVNGGGLSLRWFLEAFCQEDIMQTKTGDKNVYSFIERKVAEIPPGSNSMIYLPYLTGERSPIWDSNARGMFFGFSHTHTKYDFYRSVMEGVAYAIRHNLDIYKSISGDNIESITMSGGGAKSLLWSSIFADVLSTSIIIPKVLETETKGSAFLAGLGVGIYSSMSQAKDLTNNSIIIKPNLDNKNKYNLLFNIYKNLYSHCKNDYADLHSV